ncbi:hypothetical protein THAR02_01100 [Trichoderma harzianum]|uniref:Uncharacterized protein n=1 Tax=Trichoderma harzianum TaxID=5544 RepID=A0A0F9Y3X8_TRIHA|nr:hypothetical protein THAR02_01100 [Trichoderma harzianum]
MPPPLPPYTSSFTQQYALPYSHKILKRLKAGKALSKDDDIDEPLLRIRDPDIIQNLRSQPRLPNNKRITIPSSLKAADGQDNAQQEETTQSTQPRRPRQPRQTTQSHRRKRRAKPSTRRNLSQFKVKDSQRPSQRSSQSRGRGRGRGGRATPSQSTKSSQSRPNSRVERTTKGRATRQTGASATTRLAAIAAAALETNPKTDPETQSKAKDVIVIPATQINEPDELAGP